MEPPSVLDALCTSALNFLQKSYTFIRSYLSDRNPLFSIFVAFYALVLLYLPHLFFSLFCSPVLISTAILLASILHLGASQKIQLEKDDTFLAEIEKADPVDETSISDGSKLAAEKTEEIDAAVATKHHFSEPFVEWSRRGPLEVIYEEYEGEEDDEDSPENERRRVGLDRLLSLSLYYPDSDDSSDGEFPEDFPAWDSPEHLCFRWEEEREEGLIEIPLRGKRTAGFHVEEENLIEIDLSIPLK
ncbi:hypothetical protein ACLOJK_015173 [Asimina triloba]